VRDRIIMKMRDEIRKIVCSESEPNNACFKECASGDFCKKVIDNLFSLIEKSYISKKKVGEIVDSCTKDFVSIKTYKDITPNGTLSTMKVIKESEIPMIEIKELKSKLGWEK
jgi:hypothetical protein